MTNAPESMTMNGNVIEHPRKELSFGEFQTMVGEYGLDGSSPSERVEKLRHLDASTMALFMTDVNRRAQGSEESLVDEEMVSIGEESTIDPKDRYQLFTDLIDKIHGTSSDINPERIGDTLALATVILHPFKDGNGRTSRLMSYLFHDDFDAPDANETFDQLVESRDIARKREGFLINGYIPYLQEGASRSNPKDVSHYFDQLLTDPRMDLYIGTYQNADLSAPN